jgi:hypothetical protein
MKPENNPNKPEDKVKYQYFLDNKKFETDVSSLSGATVRSQLPPEKAGYAIFLEAQGNDPDKQIADTDNFSLEKKPLRFYSVPPANFGHQ